METTKEKIEVMEPSLEKKSSDTSRTKASKYIELTVALNNYKVFILKEIIFAVGEKNNHAFVSLGNLGKIEVLETYEEIKSNLLEE